jgi:ubiquinol-cytochrome c reductase cytochrome b subunit
VPPEQRAALEARLPDSLILPIPRHVIPLPTPRRMRAQVRARLNHFYVRYWVETPSSNGHQGRYEKRLAELESRSRDQDG